MSKLTNLNKKLFGIFPVFANKKGKLIIKVSKSWDFFNKADQTWIDKNVKDSYRNQYGFFIVLNHSIRVKQKIKTLYSFLGLKLIETNEFYFAIGGKYGLMQLFKGCTDSDRLKSHWKGYVNNTYPSFTGV